MFLCGKYLPEFDFPEVKNQVLSGRSFKHTGNRYPGKGIHVLKLLE